MGSGSTGVACINTKRNFIGIEQDETYFKAAKERLEEAERNYNIWEICENENYFNWYDESNV
jgi:site-specific DNA-methyltransferase (adenine-specific)